MFFLCWIKQPQYDVLIVSFRGAGTQGLSPLDRAKRAVRLSLPANDRECHLAISMVVCLNTLTKKSNLEIVKEKSLLMEIKGCLKF